MSLFIYVIFDGNEVVVCVVYLFSEVIVIYFIIFFLFMGEWFDVWVVEYWFNLWGIVLLVVEM